MEKIREAFKEYFEGEDIELPQQIEKKGEISKARWGITYILTTDEEGKPSLEFIASHPLTNMSHILIKHDGELISLDAILEDYSYDPKIEGDKEQAEQEWHAHNKRVADELRERGLI
jgi:hypothetical protein